MAFNNLNYKITYTRGADIASASALPLFSDGDFFHVTGTTGITSLASLGVGMQVVLKFDGIVVLTHHETSLILPGDTDYTTAAGDALRFVEYSAGNWKCINAQSAGGGAGEISNAAYDATSWDGVTTIGASKNAIRDKIETMGAASISDTAYDATSWDGVTDIAPSKNAIRDKIEAMPAEIVSDTAYDATSWDGVTDIAPSKNAVRDKIETMVSESTGTWTATATCSASGTITLYSTKNLMSYHRIGDTVFYQGRITATSVSSPNGSIMISLPYTAAAGTEDSAYSSSSTYFHGVNGQIWGLFAQISPSTAYILLGEGTGDGSVSGVTAQECQANTSYIFNGSYKAVAV